ncbi:amphi-Trp domain-containing protein [Halorientalis persicus]|jgi:amphi-Trp domain-containing protein|uniref:Amphi-Trp domain-containing protein n=1 Tax=Halorientalis persicus TaxID=1367881 RepID=A0A1H8N448_9EURY|nr:amphi-Trp domain-containing protein [Halorientalis persicus]SEO24286.1 amphi-Trp domain-containing protein [Halorientalis persicus]
MPEKVLFETERVQHREDVATYLRTVADKLDDGGPITLEAGDQSVTMEPPANVEFEVKAEREGPSDAPGELSIELELEWDEDTSDSDGSLNIK